MGLRVTEGAVESEIPPLRRLHWVGASYPQDRRSPSRRTRSPRPGAWLGSVDPDSFPHWTDVQLRGKSLQSLSYKHLRRLWYRYSL